MLPPGPSSKHSVLFGSRSALLRPLPRKGAQSSLLQRQAASTSSRISSSSRTKMAGSRSFGSRSALFRPLLMKRAWSSPLPPFFSVSFKHYFFMLDLDERSTASRETRPVIFISFPQSSLCYSGSRFSVRRGGNSSEFSAGR